MAKHVLLLILLDSAFNFYLNKYNEKEINDPDGLLDELNNLNANE